MLIKFGKEMIEIGDVGVTTSLQEVKSRVEFITGCSDIKLILKGKHLNSYLDQTIGSIPGGIVAKISAIGSKQTEIDLVQQSQDKTNTRRVINDLSEDFSPSGPVHLNPRDIKRTPYCFGGIQTLPGLPNESTARSILEELSRDVGVLAVMEKHKFKVGALCELYPEGYVGVSDVCVMGLNEGNGIRILLRLRTDDLKGFRKILSIRKVLFHELAHNMHSDHDSNFYILMRQIEREVVELDWRTSKAKSTGGQASSNQYVPSERPSNQSQAQRQKQSRGPTVHILGGSGGNEDRGGSGHSSAVLLPARVAAGTAAIMRLSEEESEAERVCGSTYSHGTVHTTNTTNTTHTQYLAMDECQIQSEIPNEIQSEIATSTEMDVSDADNYHYIENSVSHLQSGIFDSHSKVAKEMQVDDNHTVLSKCREETDIEADVNVEVGEFQSEILSTAIVSKISPIMNSESSILFTETASNIGQLENPLSDIGFQPLNTDILVMDETAAVSEKHINTDTSDHTTQIHTPSSLSSSLPSSATPSLNTPVLSSLQSESDRFNYIAECVLRQLDEVVSTAMCMSESAPVERLYMLRDALAVLLGRGSGRSSGGGGVEVSNMASSFYSNNNSNNDSSINSNNINNNNNSDNIDSSSGKMLSGGDGGRNSTPTPAPIATPTPPSPSPSSTSAVATSISTLSTPTPISTLRATTTTGISAGSSGASSATVSDISDTMQLLRTIIGNAKNHPSDPKYRKVKKSTKIFSRLVGNRAGADKVLIAAGFEEKGEYYLLGREDPGLLYLVDSILEQSISVMVN